MEYGLTEDPWSEHIRAQSRCCARVGAAHNGILSLQLQPYWLFLVSDIASFQALSLAL